MAVHAPVLLEPFEAGARVFCSQQIGGKAALLGSPGDEQTAEARRRHAAVTPRSRLLLVVPPAAVVLGPLQIAFGGGPHRLGNLHALVLRGAQTQKRELGIGVVHGSVEGFARPESVSPRPRRLLGLDQGLASRRR